jgi:hypothetical protein
MGSSERGGEVYEDLGSCVVWEVVKECLRGAIQSRSASGSSPKEILERENLKGGCEVAGASAGGISLLLLLDWVTSSTTSVTGMTGAAVLALLSDSEKVRFFLS